MPLKNAAQLLAELDALVTRDAEKRVDDASLEDVQHYLSEAAPHKLKTYFARRYKEVMDHAFSSFERGSIFAAGSHKIFPDKFKEFIMTVKKDDPLYDEKYAAWQSQYDPDTLAIFWLEKAVLENDHPMEAHILMGDVLAYDDDLAKARIHYEAASVLGDDESQFRIADMYFEHEMVQQAFDEYMKIGENPSYKNYLHAIHRAGYCAYRLRENERAIALYERELAAGGAESTRRLGALLLKADPIKNRERAKKLFRAAIDAGDHHAAFQYLNEIYKDEGDTNARAALMREAEEKGMQDVELFLGDYIHKPSVPHRELAAELGWAEFKPIDTLEAAREFPDAFLVIDGDWGGITYMTVPVPQIRCSEKDLRRLAINLGEMFDRSSNLGRRIVLEDLTKEPEPCDGFDQEDVDLCHDITAGFHFSRQRVGDLVPSGRGGGQITGALWLDADIAYLKEAILVILQGRTRSMAN